MEWCQVHVIKVWLTKISCCLTGPRAIHPENPPKNPPPHHKTKKKQTSKREQQCAGKATANGKATSTHWRPPPTPTHWAAKQVKQEKQHMKLASQQAPLPAATARNEQLRKFSFISTVAFHLLARGRLENEGKSDWKGSNPAEAALSVESLHWKHLRTVGDLTTSAIKLCSCSKRT